MRDVSSELISGARTACTSIYLMFGYAELTELDECAKCRHGFSYFSQLQICSADKPMTTCEYLLYVSIQVVY